MVLAGLLAALGGCDLSYIDGYSCLNPDEDHKDAAGKPDPCHHHDLDAGTPGDAGETCAGVCLPTQPGQWIGPTLVWMGEEADAPPCPASASSESFTAHRPPSTPLCATTCTCALPTGSCALPATLTANSGTCQNAAGAVHTSFDAPANWTGACTAANAIPVGQLCGGVPCLQSVMIAPLTVNESECLPIETPTVTPPPWGTFARACVPRQAPPNCPTQNEICVPAPPTPEFKQCVATSISAAVQICPPSFPEKNFFYRDFVDNRYCAPCTCGASETSTCVGSVGLFSDAACGAPLIGPTLAIDAVSPKCHDVPAGSALGTKSASEPTYTPGKCPVTGGLLGQIDAALAWVICCQGTP